jgi:hypothetical protein
MLCGNENISDNTEKNTDLHVLAEMMKMDYIQEMVSRGWTVRTGDLLLLMLFHYSPL